MIGRKIIALLVNASLIGGVAYFFMARTVRCDEIVEPPVRSPDGKSTAISTLKACPVGLLSLTNCSVSVVLSLESSASASKNYTSIFESADASEVPTLTWVSGQELALRVNDIGAIQLSKHKVGEVQISYTVPRWIWNRLETIEADRLYSESESQDLYKAGKLSKQGLRASIGTEELVAKEQEEFVSG